MLANVVDLYLYRCKYALYYLCNFYNNNCNFKYLQQFYIFL